MQKEYPLYIGLLISLLVMILICAPHSCEWGNTVYFYFGLAVGLALLIKPFFQQKLEMGQKVGRGIGISLLWIVVWVLGFLFGEFSLLCRLF